MKFPKPARKVDKKYLAIIRTNTECAVNTSEKHYPCAGRKEVAHLRSRGAFGSDLQVVVLCLKAHREQHDIGLIDFQIKHEVNLYRIALENLISWGLS